MIFSDHGEEDAPELIDFHWVCENTSLMKRRGRPRKEIDEPEALKNLGRAIKLEREARGWSLQRLADELNGSPPREPEHRQINTSTVSRWESGGSRLGFVRGVKLMRIFPFLGLERLSILLGMDPCQASDSDDDSVPHETDAPA